MSMSGCSTTAQNGQNVPYQANLLTRCPVQIPRLAGNTGQDFDQALRAYRTLYSECAARHNQLITDINQRREIEQ
ncbi:Rz1-like lysis system protein LysC [Pectobacterium versatile]|uniref:Rz1-like lysis system protein LysC n=1 Tax=Pectobacterium versatile TaxID=2488639 RepID=UPI003AFB04BE